MQPPTPPRPLICPQAFHTLYHTDENILLGAPTGSGKTVSAELAMFRLWAAHPGDKARAAGRARGRGEREDCTRGQAGGPVPRGAQRAALRAFALRAHSCKVVRAA